MIIWTNHALDRLHDRGLTQKQVLFAFNNPDRSRQLDNSGTMEYSKSVDNHLITVVATKNDENDWVIISCWIDPPLPGTEAYHQKQRYYQYIHSGFWGKFWMQIKRQLFNQQF